MEAPPTPYIKSAWLNISFFSIILNSFQIFVNHKIPGICKFKQVLLTFLGELNMKKQNAYAREME